MKARGFTKETISQLGVSKREYPAFKVGDAIAVSVRVKEGNKERIQVFEGDVIAMHKKGASSTFTVRKISANSVAVERIFPFDCPTVDSIKFVRHGKACRAKLYYIRERIGKRARVAEKVISKRNVKAKRAAASEKATAEKKPKAPQKAEQASEASESTSDK